MPKKFIEIENAVIDIDEISKVFFDFNPLKRQFSLDYENTNMGTITLLMKDGKSQQLKGTGKEYVEIKRHLLGIDE